MTRDELIRQGVLISAGSKSTREAVGRIVDMVLDECEAIARNLKPTYYFRTERGTADEIADAIAAEMNEQTKEIAERLILKWYHERNQQGLQDAIAVAIDAMCAKTLDECLALASMIGGKDDTRIARAIAALKAAKI